MKNIIYVILIGLPLFFMQSSCFLKGNNSSQVATPELIVQLSTNEEDDDDKNRNSRRRSGEYGSRGIRCETDDDCMDICEDLYDNDGAIDECGELRSSLVKEMEDLIDDIGDDDITVKELERYDEDVFRDMLEVSAYPWVYTISRRVSGSRHADTLLSWIANNCSILQAVIDFDGKADFSSDYKAYEGFAHLLEEAVSSKESNKSQCERYCSILGNSGKVIGAGRNFLEIFRSQTCSLSTLTIAEIAEALPFSLEDDRGSDTCDIIISRLTYCEGGG